jgi:hypothetical protein
MYIAVLLSKLKMHCHCVCLRKINSPKIFFFKLNFSVAIFCRSDYRKFARTKTTAVGVEINSDLPAKPVATYGHELAGKILPKESAAYLN